MLTLTEEEARLLRARAQGVGGGCRETAVGGVIARCFAVQAQDMAAAMLGLRVRARGLHAEDVRRATDVERSLVRGWFMRGTLYLVAAPDARWLRGLLGPTLLRRSERRYRELGLDATRLRLGEQVICSALAQDGPLTRAELVSRLAGNGLDPAGQVPVHLIRRCALLGSVCHGPARDDGEATFVLADDWLALGPASTGDFQDTSAVTTLARRYLAAHGPASVDDFVTWSGLPVPEGRRGWQNLADAGETVECAVGGQICALPADVSPGVQACTDVRLLPAYDNYLVGYRTRRLSVLPQHERRVWPGGGQIRATVVVDGLVHGTWARVKRGRDIQAEMFGPEPEQVRTAVQAERGDIVRFVG